MKKLSLLTIAAALLAGTAVHAETGTGTARANIVTALSVAGTTDLNFGNIVTQADAGTVTISTTGALTKTGNLVTFGAVSAGVITINGHPSQNVTVSIADTTLTGAGAAMDLDTYKLSPASPVPLDSNGTKAVSVGATLHVNAAQAVGAYTGTYQITVNY